MSPSWPLGSQCVPDTAAKETARLECYGDRMPWGAGSHVRMLEGSGLESCVPAAAPEPVPSQGLGPLSSAFFGVGRACLVWEAFCSAQRSLISTLTSSKWWLHKCPRVVSANVRACGSAPRASWPTGHRGCSLPHCARPAPQMCTALTAVLWRLQVAPHRVRGHSLFCLAELKESSSSAKELAFRSNRNSGGW